MKRSLEDSDNDDLFDEDDVKDGSPSQSYHTSDRKKRRGVIEKRRRDRINSSLTELRRLVPAAFEKQGSAKLEKAEILQMAVDHLKTLNARGLAGYNVDTASLALDYRLLGFRECAAEVARYLVSGEGLDIQDPLRLRVMNHLHGYCAQREASLSAKASSSSGLHNTWNHHHHGGGSNPYGAGPTAALIPGAGGVHHYGGGGSSQMEQLVMAATHPAYIDNGAGLSSGCSRMSHHHSASSAGDNSHLSRLPSAVVSSMSSGAALTQMTSTSCSLSSSGQLGAPQSVLAGLTPAVHAQFFGSMPMLSPNGLHYNSAASMALSQGMRPYRPWGADLVY